MQEETPTCISSTSVGPHRCGDTGGPEIPRYEALLSGADPDEESLMEKHLCGTHLHGSKPVEKTSAGTCKKHTCGRHLR